jgi:phosphate/sulfate permease
MSYEVLLPVLGIVAAIAFVMYRAQLLPFTAGTPGRRPVRATEPENPYPAVSIRCASSLKIRIPQYLSAVRLALVLGRNHSRGGVTWVMKRRFCLWLSVLPAAVIVATCTTWIGVPVITTDAH